MSTPKRIQRKRTKGWRMPDNTVYVGRPTKWGNPFTLDDNSHDYDQNDLCTAKFRVFLFRPDLVTCENKKYHLIDIYRDISELRGKDLACWCPLDKPCHADVLLELANKELCHE